MLESLKGTFDKSVAAVSVKSESLVETSRTKAAITVAQKKQDNQFFALGSKTYCLWKNGQNDITLLLEDFRAIQATESEISALLNRLEQIKQEENRILGTSSKAITSSESSNEDISFCRNCGKKLTADSRFCSECGTPKIETK